MARVSPVSQTCGSSNDIVVAMVFERMIAQASGEGIVAG